MSDVVCAYVKRQTHKQKNRLHLLQRFQAWLYIEGYLSQLKCQSKYSSFIIIPSSAPSAIDLFLSLLASMTHLKSSLHKRQGKIDVIIVASAASVFLPTAHLSKRRGDRWRDETKSTRL